MKKQQLEKSIEYLKYRITLIENYIKEFSPSENFKLVKLNELQHFNLAIDCMQNELERLENKLLSFEELENMIGEPVWAKFEENYVLIFAIDKYDNGLDIKYFIEYVLPNGDKKHYKIKDCVFYKHKPKENDDE